jgi:light-regulated signal transduction histidine kinase (bacteriophytochrome)
LKKYEDATREELIEKINELEQQLRFAEESSDEFRNVASDLARGNRDLLRFVSVTAHDLREPLCLIQAFGDRLHKRYGNSLSDHGRRYLERIENSASRMQNLIQGLLMYSRVSIDKQSFVQTDLTEIIQEVLADIEIRIEQTNARLEISELPVITADPVQMRQLFQNLICNAIKFRHKDKAPVVKISSSIQEPDSSGRVICQIRIEDNGIGFDEKYHEHIFNIFNRLHKRSEYEGAGIGLAICKMIVERHEGLIHARSEPFKGAVFTVSLPIGRVEERFNRLV